jgi:enterochelin esterase-like enzyme
MSRASVIMDNLIAAKKAKPMFKKAGISYHYTESAGGPTWANWRIYLNEFAPSLTK